MTSRENIQRITFPLGKIDGIKKQTIYDKEYYSFEGIPYAKPPIKELRFKAPQPVEPWFDVRRCIDFSVKPVQMNETTGLVEGTEDCLYLNVYSKTLESDKPLAVIFHIFGGAFCTGSATRDLYSPDYLMEQHIVLVTFNYRLCSLGFLSLGERELEVPGNAGLKDQVLALKWVHEYISYFNGDPNNITVVGNSAGAASAHYLMIAEQARGLFHKAVLMSGCAFNEWASGPCLDFAYRLAKYHGYTGENTDRSVLEFLQLLEPSQLVKHDILEEDDRRNGIIAPFLPVIEPYHGEDCILQRSAVEMTTTAWGNSIPVIISAVAFEGAILYPKVLQINPTLSMVKEDPITLVPYNIRVNHNDDEIDQFAQYLLHLHFGNLTEPEDPCLDNFLDYYNYKIFWHAIYRNLLSRLHYSTAKTYMYRFSFDSQNFIHFSANCRDVPSKHSPVHGDDLGYLFYFKDAWKLKPDSVEFRIIQCMVGILTSFANNSDPNCTAIEPVTWKPVTGNFSDIMVLDIGEHISFVKLPEKLKLAFWNGLYWKEPLY